MVPKSLRPSQYLSYEVLGVELTIQRLPLVERNDIPISTDVSVARGL